MRISDWSSDVCSSDLNTAIRIKIKFMVMFRYPWFALAAPVLSCAHRRLTTRQPRCFSGGAVLSPERGAQTPAAAWGQTIAIPWWILMAYERVRNHLSDKPYRF